MSKKFKAQASSARAASAASTFGSASPGFGSHTAFQTTQSSLSYVTEFPDLTNISDPHLVVSFKNLGKKDSTTKAKALEELQDQLFSSAETVIDSSLLEVWVALYPRAAIDNSRRVRQLAHTVQGALTKAAGKQIVPHLPKAIGSWLAGTYDNDKIPARAAQEALNVSFNTYEKRKTIWKIYRPSIIEYINDAILVQTPQTLSDERTTSADDAEAKHVRVVGSAMQMLAQLIRGSGDHVDDLSDLVPNSRLWEYAYNKDAFLRRSACSVATICSSQMPNSLDWPTMSTCFLARGLNTAQFGSIRSFLETLVALTRARPELWTEDYRAKTTASKRLHHFLRLGSQRGPSECWYLLGNLVKSIPTTIWKTEKVSTHGLLSADCNSLLDSLFTGVTHADESRQNASAAWATYMDLCRWTFELLDDSPVDLMTQHLSPLVEQYIAQDAEKSQWNVPTQSQLPVCNGVLLEFMSRSSEAFDHLWFSITLKLIDNMKLSLPESSKEFRTSQDAVVEQGRRFTNLRIFCLSRQKSLSNFESISKSLKRHDEAIIDSSVEVLKSRNAKPYGAAGVLQSLLEQPDISTTQALVEFVRNDVPNLLESPSAEKLILLCFKVDKASVPKYVPFLAKAANGNSYSAEALRALISRMNDTDLDDKIIRTCQDRISTDSLSTGTEELMFGILSNKSLRFTPLLEAVYIRILEGLEVEKPSAEQEVMLRLLERCFKTGPPSVDSVLADPFAGKLLSSLVLLGDTHDPSILEKAVALTSRVKGVSSQQGTMPGTGRLITEQLSGLTAPIPIYTLVDLARDHLQASKDQVAVILPTDDQWQAALRPHMIKSRPYSLAITSQLQGLVYVLVNETSEPLSQSAVRDADDFSLALRLTFYATKVLSSAQAVAQVPAASLRPLFDYLPVALYLVNEKLTIDSANDMWINSSPEVIDEMTSLITEGNRLLQSFMQRDTDADSDADVGSSLAQRWISIEHKLHGLGPESYCAAHAFVEVMERVSELSSNARLLDAFAEDMKSVHRSSELVKSASLVAAMRDQLTTSPVGTRLCNQLIADVTNLRQLSYSVPDLRPVVLLNILLQDGGDTLEAVPTQRLVFMLKNLIVLLVDQDSSQPISEVLKLLTTLLPYVQDIYGEHWEQIVEILLKIWSTDLHNEADLPILHTSMKCYSRLKSLKSKDDANEDLVEAYDSKDAEMRSELLQCLHLFLVPATGADQPRHVTTELLKRQFVDYKPTKVDDLWYELLHSGDDAVQATAFQLLHSAIPHQQEELSVELALNDVPVEISKSLESMVNDFPNRDNSAASKRYLLSWVLVFDHFENASYKLQVAYTSDIKGRKIVGPLLDLICDLIRVTSQRPIDPSKYEVQSTGGDSLQSPEAEIQQLAVHLYYESLLHLPGLVKEWYISQKNRVKYPLEAWTQKYISPLIMQASVSSVTEWSSTQSHDSDDHPVTIKSATRGSEITASIQVDPESPPIALSISLPVTYPLDSPSVNSVTRVGVSEKKWQSWLRTIQIIIFSTGSIVEGLLAFRRNVQGALQGHTECAICYSIIGTEMKTPDKKCGTCRNVFHGACLFRWFKSSNSSSCPLCRNNFMYA